MVDNPYKIQIGKRILMDIVSSVSNVVLILIVYLIVFLFNFDSSKILLSTLPIIALMFMFFVYLFIVVGFKILYKLAYYSTLSYSIETDHIVFRGGIISRFERSLPYSKMQHAIVYRTLWQRIFGLSSLSIVTARE